MSFTMNRLKKIANISLSVIEYILIFIFSIYLIFMFYQKYFNKDDLLIIGNYTIFEIASGSMEEGLHVKDTIIVKKLDNYQVGDVITYKSDGVYITHRIVQINNDEIITKGDANESNDNPISKDDIVGKYVRKAVIISFFKKYNVQILIIIITYIVIKSIFDYIKKMKKD